MPDNRKPYTPPTAEILPRTALKPCPFCGGEAAVMRGVYQLVFIKCKNKNCGAVVSFDNSLTNYLPKRAYDQYNRRVCDNDG